MFFRPDDGHGLPHNPFKAIVSPRPIAWISTRDEKGTPNLAPYSFFNAMADAPPQVVFGSTGAKDDQIEGKDTLANIRATGVFCINTVAAHLQAPMNASTAPLGKDVDEFEIAGIKAAECHTIDCLRVAEVPASLECEMSQIIRLEGENNFIVIGRVTGIHMRDEYIKDGRFDVSSFKPLTRLGYKDYSAIDTLFEIDRPKT